MNDIGFQDENELWLLKAISGHYFITKIMFDDTYVIRPNNKE